MLLGLSAAQKAGIAGMGAAFILFAFLSAMVIPRFRPEFPGRFLKPFVALVVVFFAGMMATVVFVGREAGAKAVATGASVSTPTVPASPAAGNPALGKAVFTSAGCIACHTFKPAGANGTVGPDLDRLALYASQANQRLAAFVHKAIVSPPAAYVPPGFPTNVMPTTFGSSLSATQINNLVAFLTQGRGPATTPTPPATTSNAGQPAAGSEAAGKALFANQGCSACHTFTPANSTGTIGPNLDRLASYASKSGQPLTQFVHKAIVHPPAAYVPPGYPTNVMPTSFGQTLTTTQINDLVAFLTHK